MELATITGDLTVTDAQYLAPLPAAHDPEAGQGPTAPAPKVTPTTGSTQNTYVLWVIALCLLVATLIVSLVQRSRRSRPKPIRETALPNAAILASDENRDQVTEELRHHYENGRLTLEGLNQRIEATLRARTVGDLSVITRDLPVKERKPLH